MVVSARGLPGRNCAVENTPGGTAEGKWGGSGRGGRKGGVCFKWGSFKHVCMLTKNILSLNDCII